MEENIKIITLGFVNAYLLPAAGGYILIDTGLPGQFDKLEAELLAASCLPDKLKLIIITHGDWDHTGNASALREKYKVRIAMHSGDVPQVENGLMLKRKVRPLLYRLAFSLMRLKRKLSGTMPAAPKFKPDLLLVDGQGLEEFGSSAKIVHLPGHTPGSIAVLTAGGALFAGDTFVNRKKPDSAQIIENSGQLAASLERLKGMNILTVYPGHGRPFQMAESQQDK